MRLPGAFRSRVNLYRDLVAAGVRPSSALLYPLRRRIPRRARNRIDLVTGAALVSSLDELLLKQFGEIWMGRGYLPHAWGQIDRPTVIDIGANVGVFTVWAAQELEPGRIIAIEPSPQSARLLRENLTRNEIANAEVIEVAVGGQRDEVSLYRRGDSERNTVYPRDRVGSRFELAGRVRMIMLDDVFELFRVESCDLLKLDCEGAEYEILFGASEASLTRIRHIVGEYHEGLNEHMAHELRDFLQHRGFEVTLFPPMDEEGGHFHASRPREPLPKS